MAAPRDVDSEADWMDSAPRLRVRTAADRARLQLADLAVLNERLAKLEDGTSSVDQEETVKARKRVEFMKRSRKTWSKVYDYLMDNDVDCTVDAIEAANAKVMSIRPRVSSEDAGSNTVLEKRPTDGHINESIRARASTSRLVLLIKGYGIGRGGPTW